MKQVVIENPIINSPFEEPKRRFRFTEEGITNEIVEERRKSSYFIPIPQPKKKGTALFRDGVNRRHAKLDITPTDLRPELGKSKIVITTSTPSGCARR